MITLIEYLTAIREYAKDIHYTAEGESFYGIHLLMDRVADGIYDTIDTIKEVCYLGGGNNPPKSAEILRVASAYIPPVTSSTTDNLRQLEDLIHKTIEQIQMVHTENRAVNSILDGLAQDLMLKKGLILKTIKQTIYITE